MMGYLIIENQSKSLHIKSNIRRYILLNSIKLDIRRRLPYKYYNTMSNNNNEEVNDLEVHDLAEVLEAVDINNNNNNDNEEVNELEAVDNNNDDINEAVVPQANNEDDIEVNDDDVFNVLLILASIMSGEDHHEQAAATMAAIAMMRRSLSQLARYSPSQGTLRVDIATFGLENPELMLQPNDLLLPYWRRFCEALSSISSSGCISLVLSAVQLDVEVMGMLLGSFKKSPLKQLTLNQNGLGAQGLKFVVRAIDLNTSLECLDIRNNIIESKDDAAFLVNEVIKHPTIDTLILDKCGFQDDSLMKAIIPALDNMLAISLEENKIGKAGVELIAECLASNPLLKCLSLKGDLLTDQNAQVLAEALKTNTNLRHLNLKDNSFTNVGISRLFELVYSAIDLNAIHESNHSCRLVDTENELSGFNILMDPKRNRHAKLFMALSSRFNMLYLDDTPIEIMPKVITFVQGRGQLKEGSNLGLNSVYGIMSEWNMPLLYTGSSCL